MKLQITLKDPDALEDQIGQGIVDQLFTGNEKLSNEEVEAVVEKRKQSILDLASTWFEYSEYLVVEIDTDEKSIRVVPVKEQS